MLTLLDFMSKIINYETSCGLFSFVWWGFAWFRLLQRLLQLRRPVSSSSLGKNRAPSVAPHTRVASPYGPCSSAVVPVGFPTLHRRPSSLQLGAPSWTVWYVVRLETLQVPQPRNRDHRDWLHESAERPKERSFSQGRRRNRPTKLEQPPEQPKPSKAPPYEGE